VELVAGSAAVSAMIKEDREIKEARKINILLFCSIPLFPNAPANKVLRHYNPKLAL